MHGGRSLVVLLVVALGLGAYIYFVESERDPAATEAREPVFSVTPSEITALTVRSAGDTTTLQRTGETWALTAPVEAPADITAVEAVLNGLEAMEIDRVLDDVPSDLTPFGLDAPDVQVSFTTADGTSHQVALGNTTPTNSGIYAQADDNPRVLLVPAFHKATFERTPFELRNRQALAVERDAIDRVTLTPRGEAAIDLRRDGAEWRLAAPVAARADFTAVDALVSRLDTAQMSSVVAEGSELTAAQLRTFGLDTPQLTVDVRAGSTTATLALGAARDDTSVYARDLSRPIVFTVETSLRTDLTKEPADLRVKDIFAFNAFSARSIDLTHRDTAVAYAKSTPAEGADPSVQPTWSRTRPEASEVNQTALTDLLNAVSSLRAERFVDQAPASGDTLEVAVRFGTTEAPTEERVTLRRSGDTAYATRQGEPGAAVFAPEEFDTILSHLDTLTSPPPAPAATAAPE